MASYIPGFDVYLNQSCTLAFPGMIVVQFEVLSTSPYTTSRREGDSGVTSAFPRVYYLPIGPQEANDDS